MELTSPKTKKSKRRVPLPTETMRLLKMWRTQQRREKLWLGSEWKDQGFV